MKFTLQLPQEYPTAPRVGDYLRVFSSSKGYRIFKINEVSQNNDTIDISAKRSSHKKYYDEFVLTDNEVLCFTTEIVQEGKVNEVAMLDGEKW